MYDSDRQYLSRFALDPDMEYGSEDLYGTDFSAVASYDDEPDPLRSGDLDPEDPFLEDDLF